MKKTLSRYNKCLDSSESAVVQYKPEKQDNKDVDVLKDEIAKLQSKQLRLLGKDLAGLTVKELQQLEHQLNEGLIAVKEKKERILMEQLEQSRLQEQRAMLENATLRRQVEELRGFFPSADCPVSNFLDHHPVERKNCLVSNGRASPDVAYSAVEKGDSDTTLHLGLPTEICRKRKVSESEILSNDSGNGLGLL